MGPPQSAVERIEILSGAAPALHGGHAITGAVNIVLRRGYEGVEASAFVSRPNDSGGDREQGSALWGGTVGQGHMTIGLDAFRREEIPDAARAYSRARWTPGGTFGDAVGVSVGGNSVEIATRSFDDSDPSVVTEHVPDAPANVRAIARPIGACPTSIYTGVLNRPRGVQGTGCGFAYADISWNSARYERQSLFLTFDQPLDADAGMYLDVRFAQDELLERFAPSVGTFDIDSSVLQELLLADPQIDSLPDTVRVRHRFIGHSANRSWLTTLDEYDVTLGSEGELGDDIGYDAHLRYYLHDAGVDGNTFVSQSVIEGVINDGRYDLVNPLSAANRDVIRETSLRLTREQVAERRTVSASLDGPMVELGGGEARWAAGVEFAAEDWKDMHAYRDRAGVAYPAVDVLGAGGVQTEGERQSWSGFAELSLPVRDNVDVTLAGRGEDHDDVGSTYSHQVAGRLRVHDDLTLRGAWDRGSRPPTLEQLNFTRNDFPWVCDPTTLTDPLARCGREQVIRERTGNRNLDPDESESFSVGAVTGIGPVSVSADWFWIEIWDVPAQLSAQSIVDLEARGALPPGADVVRTEGGTIDHIVSPLYNSGETDASGSDVRVRAEFDAEVAELVFDTRWLHMARDETRVAGVRQPGDFPRDRVHASLRASKGNVTASWDVHSVSNFWNNRRTGQYDGWVGHNVSVRLSDAFGMGGLDLLAGVFNVADRNPSIDPTDPDSASGPGDSVRGRMVFLGATMSW